MRAPSRLIVRVESRGGVGKWEVIWLELPLSVIDWNKKKILSIKGLQGPRNKYIQPHICSVLTAGPSPVPICSSPVLLLWSDLI